ncbi:MAG: glycosyltransferase family 39 protein [Nannocystaceae bacterium]
MARKKRRGETGDRQLTQPTPGATTASTRTPSAFGAATPQPPSATAKAPTEIPASARSWLILSALAALVVSLLGLLPGLAPAATDTTPEGPYNLSWGLGASAVASATALLALTGPRTRGLALPSVLLLGYALAALEQRSQTSSWHRAVVQFVGLGPDVLIAATWGLMVAGPRQRGLVVAGLVGIACFIFSPTPVENSIAPGVSGFLVDSLTLNPAPWRFVPAILSMIIAAIASWWAWHPRSPRHPHPAALAALFATWALATGVLGAEGWIAPLATWTPWAHVPLRVAILCTIAGLVWWIAATASQGGAKHWKQLELATALAVCSAFLLVRFQTFHWSKTDENIYFYAARALGDGLLPYRDYFYAHPPVRVLLPGLVFALFGFSIWTAQAIPTVASLAAGLFIWRTARHLLGPRRGAVAGVLALTLHLGNVRTLIGSTEMSGVNMAMALACGGLWAATTGRAELAGVLSGLALGVGMVMIWMMPTIVLTAWCKHARRHGFLLLATLGTTIAALVALGTVLGGDAFFESVFRFHTLKKPQSPHFLPPTTDPFGLLGAVINNLGTLIEDGVLYQVTVANPLAWIGGVAAPLLLICPWLVPHIDRWLRFANSRPRSRPGTRRCAETKPQQRAHLDPSTDENLPPGWQHTLPLTLAIPVGLSFFSLLREHYTFYWAVFVPVLALMAGCAAAGWLSRLSRMSTEPVRRHVVWLALALAPTTIAADWSLSSHPFGERKIAGRVRTFAWHSTAPTDGLDGLTASLIWKPHVIRGEFETPVDRFLWMKKKTFSVAPDIARFVAENTTPDATLTGASLYAPIVALLAGRRVAANEVDTNAKVFQTGLRSEPSFWRNACADNVQAVIAPRQGYFGRKRFFTSSSVRDDFFVAQTFHDPLIKWGRSEPIHVLLLVDPDAGCSVDH